jgi:3-hydroxyisobutyrate dehydrogenase-like beta-hydroxyacid dehydrogenase
MLLGGRTAREISEQMNALGLNTKPVADDIGLASAIKLCRSIMIKGTEALCVQSMMAARHFGVDERVLTSLAATFPGVGWDKGYEAYLIGRVTEHGQRRSEEMREAAAMLAEIGMDGSLANDIADVHEKLARKGLGLREELDKEGRLPQWRTLLANSDIA